MRKTFSGREKFGSYVVASLLIAARLDDAVEDLWARGPMQRRLAAGVEVCGGRRPHLQQVLDYLQVVQSRGLVQRRQAVHVLGREKHRRHGRLGLRLQRFQIIVDNGRVNILNCVLFSDRIFQSIKHVLQ